MDISIIHTQALMDIPIITIRGMETATFGIPGMARILIPILWVMETAISGIPVMESSATITTRAGEPVISGTLRAVSMNIPTIGSNL